MKTRTRIILSTIIIVILGAIFYFPLKYGSEQNVEKQTTSEIDSEERTAFDNKLAKGFVKFSEGIIASCKVNSHELDKRGTTVYVDIYFREVPRDLYDAIEYICEATHDIYKSEVLVKAYRPTSAGGDWRKIAISEWSLYTNQVITKLY